MPYDNDESGKQGNRNTKGKTRGNLKTRKPERFAALFLVFCLSNSFLLSSFPDSKFRVF
jgi:hypothetical protein